MIHTDGTATVANAERQNERRAVRQSATILRAWYSVLSAYPDAATPFCVRRTAQRCKVSKTRVLQALGSTLESGPVSTRDWRDYDPNRWNLH